jgi:hypothetical protein
MGCGEVGNPLGIPQPLGSLPGKPERRKYGKHKRNIRQGCQGSGKASQQPQNAEASPICGWLGPSPSTRRT